MLNGEDEEKNMELGINENRDLLRLLGRIAREDRRPEKQRGVTDGTDWVRVKRAGNCAEWNSQGVVNLRAPDGDR